MTLSRLDLDAEPGLNGSSRHQDTKRDDGARASKDARAQNIAIYGLDSKTARSLAWQLWIDQIETRAAIAAASRDLHAEWFRARGRALGLWLDNLVQKHQGSLELAMDWYQDRRRLARDKKDLARQDAMEKKREKKLATQLIRDNEAIDRELREASHELWIVAFREWRERAWLPCIVIWDSIKQRFQLYRAAFDLALDKTRDILACWRAAHDLASESRAIKTGQWKARVDLAWEESTRAITLQAGILACRFDLWRDTLAQAMEPVRTLREDGRRARAEYRSFTRRADADLAGPRREIQRAIHEAEILLREGEHEQAADLRRTLRDDEKGARQEYRAFARDAKNAIREDERELAGALRNASFQLLKDKVQEFFERRAFWFKTGRALRAEQRALARETARALALDERDLRSEIKRAGKELAAEERWSRRVGPRELARTELAVAEELRAAGKECDLLNAKYDDLHAVIERCLSKDRDVYGRKISNRNKRVAVVRAIIERSGGRIDCPALVELLHDHGLPYSKREIARCVNKLIADGVVYKIAPRAASSRHESPETDAQETTITACEGIHAPLMPSTRQVKQALAEIHEQEGHGSVDIAEALEAKLASVCSPSSTRSVGSRPVVRPVVPDPAPTAPGTAVIETPRCKDDGPEENPNHLVPPGSNAAKKPSPAPTAAPALSYSICGYGLSPGMRRRYAHTAEAQARRNARMPKKLLQRVLVMGFLITLMFIGEMIASNDGVAVGTTTVSDIEASCRGPAYQLTDFAEVSFSVQVRNGLEPRAWVQAYRNGKLVHEVAYFAKEGRNTCRLELSPQYFSEGFYIIKVLVAYYAAFIYPRTTSQLVLTEGIQVQRETAIVSLDCSVQKLLKPSGIIYSIQYEGKAIEDDRVPITGRAIDIFTYNASRRDYQLFTRANLTDTGEFGASEERASISPWPLMAKAVLKKDQVYNKAEGSDSVTAEEAYANWKPSIPDGAGWTATGEVPDKSYIISPGYTGLNASWNWGKATGEVNDYLGYTVQTVTGAPGVGIGDHLLYFSAISGDADVDAAFISKPVHFECVEAKSAIVTVRFQGIHQILGTGKKNCDLKTANVSYFSFYIEILDYKNMVLYHEELMQSDSGSLVTRNVNVTWLFQAPRVFKIKLGARMPVSALAPPERYDEPDRYYAGYDFAKISIINDPCWVSSTLVENSMDQWSVQEQSTSSIDITSLGAGSTMFLTNMHGADSSISGAEYATIGAPAGTAAWEPSIGTDYSFDTDWRSHGAGSWPSTGALSNASGTTRDYSNASSTGVPTASAGWESGWTHGTG
nr:hypothetical protein [Candidatus Sigynarchaeum springense]